VPAERPLPLVDASRLDAQARRTRLVRAGLAAALLAALVAAWLVAPRHPGRRYLPANAVGIVVLDVSSSVRPTTYYRIEQTLASLAASKGRLGLVVFSDVAYAALPTGTRAVALKPLLRFFAPPKNGADFAGSPWQQWFSAGTKVSTGLYLAERMLEQQGAKSGAVLLISDLADDPLDFDALKESVLLLEQKGYPLEIVGLDPSVQNVRFWRRLLGDKAVFQTARLPTGAEARGEIKVENGFSRPLLLVALLVVGLLAVNEWWAEPFRFRRRLA
jgi:hypothetical protein